jgi:hypothetical protein
MAIHKDYTGMTAEVMVNDEALEEYTDFEAAGAPNEVTNNEVTKYIDAQSGMKPRVKGGQENREEEGDRFERLIILSRCA